MSDQLKSEEDSSLKKRIDQDIKDALKGKDAVTLSVLRMTKSEIRYKEIEKGSKLSDDETLAVLSSSMKKRKDSIEQFEKGGREDLASRERTELEVLTRYLPEQLTQEKLSEIVQLTIAELNATGPSNLGTVMKQVMLKVRGKADGKIVNQLVSSQLQKIANSQD
jgi:uncharacterized protein YqeY